MIKPGDRLVAVIDKGLGGGVGHEVGGNVDAGVFGGWVLVEITADFRQFDLIGGPNFGIIDPDGEVGVPGCHQGQ